MTPSAKLSWAQQSCSCSSASGNRRDNVCTYTCKEQDESTGVVTTEQPRAGCGENAFLLRAAQGGPARVARSAVQGRLAVQTHCQLASYIQLTLHRSS